jgi:hypothetical protein
MLISAGLNDVEEKGPPVKEHASQRLIFVVWGAGARDMRGVGPGCQRERVTGGGPSGEFAPTRDRHGPVRMTVSARALTW